MDSMGMCKETIRTTIMAPATMTDTTTTSKDQTRTPTSGRRGSTIIIKIVIMRRKRQVRKTIMENQIRNHRPMAE